MSLDILLAAIGTPELAAAACKGKHRIFDPRLQSDPERERMEHRATRRPPWLQHVFSATLFAATLRLTTAKPAP
jgi:hypothetical protein